MTQNPLSSTVIARRPPGRPQKYPWAKWLDGVDKVLKQGIDFPRTKTPESIRSMILNHARRRGLMITTVVEQSAVLIAFEEWTRPLPDRLFDSEWHSWRGGLNGVSDLDTRRRIIFNGNRRDMRVEFVDKESGFDFRAVPNG